MDLERYRLAKIQPREGSTSLSRYRRAASRLNTSWTRFQARSSSIASCIPRCSIPGQYTVFVPHTLAEDGDPLDVLIVGPAPVVPGGGGCVLPTGSARY